jgi:hypothetical protein
MKRRSRISEQFSPRKRSMLESAAYRTLSLSAHRVISRIELELCYHGGNDNGKLPLTYVDFVEYGIELTSIAPAIREAEALGFIRVTERGRAGNREYRKPNLFRLTFSHDRESRSQPPTDDWRKIKTIEEAAAIAKAARAAKDKRAVALGRRSWRARKPLGKNQVVSLRKTQSENHENHTWKNLTTASLGKTVVRSKARGGGHTPGSHRGGPGLAAAGQERPARIARAPKRETVHSPAGITADSEGAAPNGKAL